MSSSQGLQKVSSLELGHKLREREELQVLALQVDPVYNTVIFKAREDLGNTNVHHNPFVAKQAQTAIFELADDLG